MARRLSIVCALALAAAGCGHGTTANGPLAWTVHTGPLRVDAVAGSHKLTELGGDAPLTYVTADGVEHQLTTLISRSSRGGTTTLKLSGGEARRTARLVLRAAHSGLRATLALTPASGVAAIRFTLSARPSAHFLGSGERTSFVDLQKTVQPLKVWNSCDSSAPAPFFASTDGFGASVTSTAVGRIAFPDAIDDANFACDLDTPSCSVGPPVAAVRICLKTPTASLEITRGTPQQVVSAYVKRTGLPRAPWLPQFALMQWRDEISGPAVLLGDIHQLQSRHLPVGWVILDNPWETGATGGCFGSLRFDRSRYPDPAGTIRKVHSEGVRFMLWISPELRKKGCPPAGYPDGWLTGDDDYYVRDLTNPPERADFVRRVGALAALGVDGFKGDRGDEVDLEKNTLAGGSGVLLQNAYPLLYARAVADAMKPYRKQWASLFRSAAPGSAAVLPGFVGQDREQTWNGLYDAIREAQTAGVAGEAMWGADIGGYQGGGDVTPELLGRWAQFAALTPIFEVGGAGANATFWRLGAGAVERFRAAATLHYELVPYLFDLVQRASETGLSPIRPLGLTWPGDERSWSQDAEFTVGANLLAAPVIAPATGGTTTTTNVYLPPGDWIDFFTGARSGGGKTITRSSGPSDFPLYVRDGAALAANLRRPEIWADPWRVDDLIRPGRQGWLVAPRSGAVATARTRATTLAATETGGSITITLKRAAREQQLLVLTPAKVCRVLVDGAPAPRSAGASGLRARPAGWLVEAGPRHGVVVKARVGRTARIALQAC